MTRLIRNAALAIILGLSGSAIMAAQASAQSCDSYARDYANRTTRTGNNVVGGAVGGAVVGGVIGSVTGSWGRGAAIGGGVGAAAGAGKSSIEWDRAYKRAYNDCMARRNTRSAPRGGGLEPWTPQWYDYCGRKYRSFNPNTGYYTTYGGQQRFCR
ncbi:BA14K family protein [uncultured Roseibium sp.]|uniref:BA14K family protein n=1 Tax=uncultured Roseibium sp. TaxID=1936171 RepID=UPI0032172706